MSTDTGDGIKLDVTARKKKYRHRVKRKKDVAKRTQEASIGKDKGNKNTAHVRCPQRCYSNFISQQRMTRRLGIYKRGKKSTMIIRHQVDLVMSPETKARANEDLQRILDLSDTSISKIGLLSDWTNKHEITPGISASNNRRQWDSVNCSLSGKIKNETPCLSDNSCKQFSPGFVVSSDMVSPASISSAQSESTMNVFERLQETLVKKCAKYYSYKDVTTDIRKDLQKMYLTRIKEDHCIQSLSSSQRSLSQTSQNESFPEMPSLAHSPLPTSIVQNSEEIQIECDPFDVPKRQNNNLSQATSNFFMNRSNCKRASVAENLFGEELPSSNRISNILPQRENKSGDLVARLDWLETLEKDAFLLPISKPEVAKRRGALTLAHSSPDSDGSPTWRPLPPPSPFQLPSATPTAPWRYPRHRMF